MEFASFLDPCPPTHTNNFSEGIKNVFRPPHTLVNISWNLPVSVFRPPTHTKNLRGGIKKLIFFANVHVKRRQLIFHGILLTVDHHSEK